MLDDAQLAALAAVGREGRGSERRSQAFAMLLRRRCLLVHGSPLQQSKVPFARRKRCFTQS